MNDEVEQAIARANTTGEFTLSGTKLDHLPEALRDVSDLESINLYSCGLRGVPTWLGDFRELATLNLSGNKLGRRSWVNICNCSSLVELGLSQCRLGGVPRELSGLERLEALTLSGNSITHLPSHTTLFSPKLRFLDLGGNPLQDLPPLILPELEYLYMWGNYFKELPSSLALTLSAGKLKVLDVSSTGVDSVGDLDIVQETPDATFNGRLVGAPKSKNAGSVEAIPTWLADTVPLLAQLWVGGNQIASFPNELRQLDHLTYLFAANNRLTDFPESLLDLPSLKYLDLSSNRISVAPAWAGVLDSLDFLNLKRNPIGIPEEILSETREPQRVLEYLDEIGKSGRPLNEAKIVLVGEGSVGKTSIVKALRGGAFDRGSPKTEGIEKSRWMVPNTDVSANIWDFGGQEIMHATHQFFLSARSLYILVLDSRQGEVQNRLDYWLRIIDTYSESSPVLIVGNKVDQSPLDIDERGIRGKYPNVRAVLPTSCSSGSGIDNLVEAIRQGLDDLPHLRDKLPISYFNVKTDLEKIDENYLAYDSYRAICEGYEIANESAQEALISFLHDLGTVLCFRDDPRLADTNILSPAWVTGGVYKILNSNLANHKGGLVSSSDIAEVLDGSDYPPERRGFIVSMMRKFELCYESDGILFIPDLLTKAEPDTGAWDEGIKVVVKYAVLPPSILCRLIVRLSHLVSKQTVWRSGVVFAWEQNRALVRADYDDNSLSIVVTGHQTTRRTLLTMIRSELRRVEATIPGLDREERVPVPDEPDSWVPYAHLVSLESAGHQTVIPVGLIKEYEISVLLEGVEQARDRFSEDSVAEVTAAPGKDSRRLRAESIDVVHDESSKEATQLESSTENWSPSQSIALGALLLSALVVVTVVFVIASNFVAEGFGWTIGVAVVALVILGLFVMRASGRLSEGVFASLIDSAMGKLGNGASSTPESPDGPEKGDGRPQV